MLFNFTNRNDIDKYYTDTYVKFREFGDRLFFIQGVSATAVYGTTEDDEVFELGLSDDAPYEVDYILPSRANFQYGDNAFLLQRIPARQWKRGLCKDNTRVLNLSNGDSRTLTFDLLRAYVNKQQYFTLHEATRAKAKFKTMALSPRFNYVRSTGDIRCDLTKIAVYNYDRKMIQNIRPLFRQDIIDLMSQDPVKEAIE